MYPTSSGDGGREAARRALAEGAELVVVCGGDGTVSACAAALAGSGVPMAVVPIGTGNLVAGNLGIPKDLAAAVQIAVGGVDRALDVGRLGGSGDDGVMVGMAGLGLDAAMVQDAPKALKRRIGWPAYVISLVRHLADRGFDAVVDVDGEKTRHRHVRTIVVGNLGTLPGGLTMFPDARPDDGLIEVAVLAPRTVVGWVPIAARLARGGSSNRSSNRSPAVQRRRGKRIVVTVVGGRGPMRREVDGEALPDGRVFEVAVDPGALLLRSS